MNFAYSGRLYGVYFHDSTIGWTVGTNGAMFRTEDGGTNWIVTKSMHDMYAVHFSDAQSGWAVGDDGTILSTNNGGRIWILQSGNGTTKNLNSVCFVDSLRGWAAGEKMLHTTNGGKLWFEQAITHTNPLQSAFFIDDQKGYTVWDWFPYISYTMNGGISWLYLSGPQPILYGLNCVFFVDDQNGWIVGKNGDIMHTTNGGTDWRSWSRQASGTKEELNAVYFVDHLNGWAVGNKGTIIHTNNGGTTWLPQQSELGQWGNLRSVYFTDKMHGFIVGPVGMILQTTNGGTNWVIMRIGENELSNVRFGDMQTGWAVGNKGTILKTNDGGNTWGLQKSGTIEFLQSVQFVDSLTGYIVGNKGTILKTTTGGGNILFHPMLALPLDSSMGIVTNPTLSWHARSGAVSYRLQISTNPTFYTSTIAVDQSGILGTSLQITGLENTRGYLFSLRSLRLCVELVPFVL